MLNIASTAIGKQVRGMDAWAAAESTPLPGREQCLLTRLESLLQVALLWAFQPQEEELEEEVQLEEELLTTTH